MKLFRSQKRPHLVPPFKVSCSHVDVVDVQHAPRCSDVSAYAATPFSRSPRDIHISPLQNGPARQDCVSVGSSFVMTCASECRIHREFVSDGFHLSLMSSAVRIN